MRFISQGVQTGGWRVPAGGCRGAAAGAAAIRNQKLPVCFIERGHVLFS